MAQCRMYDAVDADAMACVAAVRDEVARRGRPLPCPGMGARRAT
ncbi:MAG: hypothetical protein PVG11_00620 [Anaerolineae bacterium]